VSAIGNGNNACFQWLVGHLFCSTNIRINCKDSSWSFRSDNLSFAVRNYCQVVQLAAGAADQYTGVHGVNIDTVLRQIKSEQ